MAETETIWTRARVASVVVSTVMASIVLGACGSSDRPPPASDSFAKGNGSASGSFSDAGPTRLPGCGPQDNGSFCECVDTPLFTDPPNLYFVLDRSGSMAEGNKWDRVRVVVAQILRGLGPRANFGATVFPGFERTACALPKEVLPLSPGDPPGIDGPTTETLLTATAGAPFGGTPTAEALRAVARGLGGVTGKTFVVLATDGGPNCNAAASCERDQCMPNIESVPGCPAEGPVNCCAPPDGVAEACLDAVDTTNAVAALKAAGIPVYVVGLPGTALYASLLDTLAESGGTALAASPRYYRVDSAAGGDLLSALKKIAAKITATCEFKLKDPPRAPNLVNVYLDEVVLPKDPTNGWVIEGDTVTLVGAACSKVMAGDVLGVRVIAGCPTTLPR